MERFNERLVRTLSEISGGAFREAVVLSIWDSYKEIASAPPRLKFIPVNSSKIKTLLSFVWSLLKYRPNKILYGHVLLVPLAIVAWVFRPHAKQFLFVHGIEVWGDPGYRQPSFIELWATRKMIHRIISVSRFTATKMIELFQIEEKRFLVFLNALDIEENHKKEPSTINLNEDFRLLTVSRLCEHDWEKGCHRVIQALPLILKAFPSLQYYIVGEGTLKRKLQTLAHDYRVSDHVVFLGYVEDLRLDEIYDSSDLFIMPSTKEGFGIVYLEAWKHHLPVIVGNCDASSEIVTHGVNGYVVDSANIAEIASAVVSLLRLPQEAKRLGEAGYQTLIEKYSHGEFKKRFQEILCKD